MAKTPSTLKNTAKTSVRSVTPEGTQESKVKPAAIRTRAKTALIHRGAISLPKIAINREMTPLTRANTPSSRTIKKEKRIGELKARNPTMRERMAPVISQPLSLVCIDLFRSCKGLVLGRQGDICRRTSLTGSKGRRFRTRLSTSFVLTHDGAKF